jgi:hypothetical protein
MHESPVAVNSAMLKFLEAVGVRKGLFFLCVLLLFSVLFFLFCLTLSCSFPRTFRPLLLIMGVGMFAG